MTGGLTKYNPFMKWSSPRKPERWAKKNTHVHQRVVTDIPNMFFSRRTDVDDLKRNVLNYDSVDSDFVQCASGRHWHSYGGRCF